MLPSVLTPFCVRPAPFLLLVTGPGSNAGAFCLAGTNGNRLGFEAKEMPMPGTARNPDHETSGEKYSQTTIGDLRKLYGPGFAMKR
jgi:hypothetical protein